MTARESLPEAEFLDLSLDARGVLSVRLNRPDVRNAMNLAMVGELTTLVDTVRDRRDVRVVLLSGAGKHFCAGGDIADMAAARMTEMPAQGPDPAAVVNRAFGTMITAVDRAPQAVVAVMHGAVLGGGMGLACVADVAIAMADTRFGLPETSLGLPPAQIAAFLVRRLGRSQARRLAVTGGRFDGRAALAMGLVHTLVDDPAQRDAAVAEVLDQILRCAPGAIAQTKRLMTDVGGVEHERLLDTAAELFAEAIRGPEGSEGTAAFLQKRVPYWAPNA